VTPADIFTLAKEIPTLNCMLLNNDCMALLWFANDCLNLKWKYLQRRRQIRLDSPFQC